MANEAERALRHAVRPRIVLRYGGELGLVLGIMALVPAICAALFREFDLMLPYGIGCVFLIGVGLLARRVAAPREIQPNEALVITVLVFMAAPLVMSASLIYQGIPWIDALFESISGVTTTGLSTLASVEGRPLTFLLARSWLQWLGGLGFVVLSLALVFTPGVASRRLGDPSLSPADFVGSVRVHARRVLLIYVTLSGLGILALLVAGASFFDAVVHTLAGVSTGGFAPRDASLEPLARPIQYAVLATSFLGALSLPLYSELRHGRWRRLRDDPEVRGLACLVAVATLALLVLRPHAATDAGSSPSDLFLLAVSAQTTAGFATLPVEHLSSGAKAVLILSMLIGGSQGSTAGGFKLFRLILIVRLLQWLVSQTRLPPHAVSSPTLSGEALESSELLRAAAMILLFLAVVVLSWLPFVASGYAPLDALFEVSSATGTVGLSVGIARPALEPALKGVLCFDMLLGRLEVFAVLVFLAPRTWIGRRVAQ